ncbi:MAG: hypothetical protein LBT89_10370, partial [Planctomycetaceae bacterium]|nr:hypothetical protein [Planctomycetaceae bacterium]
MRLILVQIIFVFFVLSNWNFAADVRVEFNRAAGLVRNGKYEEAAELLRQTAAADDKDAAARSFAMLGQIDVINAKAAADNAEPQTENLTECLDKAEAHFADSLALQDRDDVRKNLEALRAWRAKTTAER